MKRPPELGCTCSWPSERPKWVMTTRRQSTSRPRSVWCPTSSEQAAELVAPADAELGVDALQRVVDGLPRDEELLRDLLRRSAPRRKLGDLPLTIRERYERDRGRKEQRSEVCEGGELMGARREPGGVACVLVVRGHLPCSPHR